MASWLKVAEDLLEVVDRRAKLVVSELSDEQSDLQTSSSNDAAVKTRKKLISQKDPPRKTVNRTGKSTETDPRQKNTLSEPNLKASKIDESNYGSAPEVASNYTSETSSELPPTSMEVIGISDPSPAGVTETVQVESDTSLIINSPYTENNVEISNSNNIVATVKAIDSILERTLSPLNSEASEKLNGYHLADARSQGSTVIVDGNLASDTQQERETTQNQNLDGQVNEENPLPALSQNTNKQVDSKADSFLMKVQDQLDEAQGLLKSAVSTGQSKEARLAKVCAGLSSRLQEYKSENSQLEELLVAERELSSSYEVRIKQLQQDLSALKAEAATVEANMAESLSAKNTEIEFLVGTVDALKKQLSNSEGKVVSLQESLEGIMRSRELTESRMIQALREELTTAEHRAEEERTAHNATKLAAVEREVELEHRAIEAANALARMQRTAEESTSRASDLEHKVALLEVECASLTQELQELEARNRRGQKKASEESNQILQIQAWQEEVERARQSQREAENKLSSMEADLQKMRVEMAGMKRDAEHYSRQEHMELEKRYRELTDLLYHKQTQLESMASEKAAAEFQLEKEVKRLQEAQIDAERNKIFRRSSALWEDDDDLKVLEPLPLHHRHMAAASIQLQKAAKLLDSGAVRATRFLWRYPVARVLLLFYLVFVHLFLMYLMHRLQAQAEHFSSREIAASMGLGNSSLP